MGGDGQGDKPLVRFEIDDGVGIITIDNPPVNALAPGVRERLEPFLQAERAGAASRLSVQNQVRHAG